MIPFVLALAPFVAKDAALSWSLDGKTTKEVGRYRLAGKGLRGEIAWYASPQGAYDAEKLFAADNDRTKEADASKGFTHVRKSATFAGMPAIESDQRYLWNGVAIASRCVYCAQGDRAWVVRLWWPPASGGAKEAEAFLKGVRRLENKAVKTAPSSSGPDSLLVRPVVDQPPVRLVVRHELRVAERLERR